MRSRSLLVSAALLAPVLLASCTSTEPGIPSPTTTTAGSNAPITGNEVPEVSNPLDLSHFQQTPCDTLTPAQADKLLNPGSTTRPDPNGPAGPACQWAASDGSQAIIGILFSKLSTNGLGDAYRQKDTAAVFQELDPIQGYPTVALDQIDARSTGNCVVLVGTSNQQTAQISVQQSKDKIGRADPCQAAHTVAEDAIATIKGRQ